MIAPDPAQGSGRQVGASDLGRRAQARGRQVQGRGQAVQDGHGVPGLAPTTTCCATGWPRAASTPASTFRATPPATTGADVQLSVTPPPQMPATLEAGTIDGYSVGEPWNQAAVAKKIGVPIIVDPTSPAQPATRSSASPRHSSEATQDGPGAAPRAHPRLDVARRRKRQEPARGGQDTRQPNYVGADEKVLMAVDDRQVHLCRGDTRATPEFNLFFGQHASYPFYSDAIWYLTQMRRWGQIAEDKPDQWYLDTGEGGLPARPLHGGGQVAGRRRQGRGGATSPKPTASASTARKASTASPSMPQGPTAYPPASPSASRMARRSRLPASSKDQSHDVAPLRKRRPSTYDRRTRASRRCRGCRANAQAACLARLVKLTPPANARVARRRLWPPVVGIVAFLGSLGGAGAEGPDLARRACRGRAMSGNGFQGLMERISPQPAPMRRRAEAAGRPLFRPADLHRPDLHLAEDRGDGLRARVAGGGSARARRRACRSGSMPRSIRSSRSCARSARSPGCRS